MYIRIGTHSKYWHKCFSNAKEAYNYWLKLYKKDKTAYLEYITYTILPDPTIYSLKNDKLKAIHYHNKFMALINQN